jgi:signal transduction histidine kinase
MAHGEIRDCPLAGVLADRLRAGRRDVTARWLERIAGRVAIEKNKIFPSDELLDHVPLLVDGIAGYLEDPVNEVSADMPVVAKAMELGALRHAQGFDVYQILKEYEILGGILFTYLAEVVDDINVVCAKSELLYCGQRLFRAVTLIQQTTTTHFLRLSDARIAEREQRLRSFNRAVSHEIKNRIGTILGASVTLLEIPDVPPEKQQQFLSMIARNARMMRHTVENLVALSRMDSNARQHRHVFLPEAVAEAARQMREASEGAGVEITVGELPDVEVNAAAVELCLTNFLSNAIKYADPKKSNHFAQVTGAIEGETPATREIVVRVRDNGLGISPEQREQLFQRFFRAHDVNVTVAEGTGLGLSIVAETMESLGGRAWAEFEAGGTVFAFALPYRRESTVDAESTDDAGAVEPAPATGNAPAAVPA